MCNVKCKVVENILIDVSVDEQAMKGQIGRLHELLRVRVLMSYIPDCTPVQDSSVVIK